MATDMISSAIVGIAGLIIVATLVATLFPQVFEAAGSITGTSGRALDRARTVGTVVNHDLPAPGALQFDVLNGGETSLSPATINMTVAYLDNETMPGHVVAPGATPAGQYWTYAISGGTDANWDPGEVLEVRVVSPSYGFAPGSYRLKLLLYNGAVVQYRFTI